MTTTTKETTTPTTPALSQRNLARLVGLSWLVIIAAGIYAEVFVRARLIVPEDAAATAANITASTGLFRLSLLGDSVMLLADVSVALLLYVLLRPVSRGLALLAAFFRLVQASVLGVNLLTLFFALLLLSGAGYLAVFETGQLHALALTALEAHAIGYDIGLIFFSFSLFVLGYLLFTSRYIPRILAVLLSLSGLVYLTGSVVTVLAPAYSGGLEPAYLLPFIAELAVALWLLIKSVDIQQDERAAAFPRVRTAHPS